MIAAHRLLPDVDPPGAVAPAGLELVVRIDGVMGGRPVIRGTRITVAAVKGRLSGGDSLDDLVADYPEVAREAFEAAAACDEQAVEPSPMADGGQRQV